MSTQKDQYANMTDATNGTSFIVNANGAATDDSTSKFFNNTGCKTACLYKYVF